jgi:hypothetical protein
MKKIWFMFFSMGPQVSFFLKLNGLSLFVKFLRILKHSWTLVILTYSGGRDQEDGGLKPDWADSSW